MAPRKLQAYHRSWLEVHPDRDAAWLKEKLSEGFDVHHLDGDHHNNEPANLVLIETVDHMRLHGMQLKNGLVGWRRQLAEKTARRNAAKKSAERIPQAANIDEASVRAYVSRLGRC